MEEKEIKKRLIRDIQSMLEEIQWLRKNHVFDEELELEVLKKIERGVSDAWYIYYKIYEKKK